jgi:hypothetical protein
LPVIEKNLVNSLETALEKTEKRFVGQHADREICEVILNLPLSNLPSVIQAVRTFYSSPNDSFLSRILIEKIKSSFPHISSERVESGVSIYIRLLKDEFVNLNGDIRDKLNVHATLGIQDNTSRMANILEKLLEQTTPKGASTYNQRAKLTIFSKSFRLPTFSSEQQALEALHRISQEIFMLLGFAFLDTCEINTSHDFNFLLSLKVLTEKDKSETLQIELICHITAFVDIFDELITLLLDKSEQEFKSRAKKYPSDLSVRMDYRWKENIPYRAVRLGRKELRFDCLDSDFFTIKSPLETSDLLVVISAMLNGKLVNFDNIDFSNLPNNESELLKYIKIAQTYGLDISAFDIDVLKPETWNVATTGMQKNRN